MKKLLGLMGWLASENEIERESELLSHRHTHAYTQSFYFVRSQSQVGSGGM